MFQYKDKLLSLAEIILQRIGSWDLSSLEAKDKSDGSPVTIFDEELNELINSYLIKNYPDYGIIGEEISRPSTQASFTWYVDPLDGTKEFIKRNGQWAVQIGLCEENTPIVGFVLHPEEKRLYYAEKGQGSYLIEMSSKKETKLCLTTNDFIDPIISLESNSSPAKDEAAFSSKIASKSFKKGSFGLKVAMIATGEAHLYCNFRKLIGYWDLCGPQVVLEEAGGRFRFEDGKQPNYLDRTDYSVNLKLVAYHPCLEQGVLDEF